MESKETIMQRYTSAERLKMGDDAIARRVERNKRRAAMRATPRHVTPNKRALRTIANRDRKEARAIKIHSRGGGLRGPNQLKSEGKEIQ